MFALYKMKARMESSPTGRRILEEKPRVREATIDLLALRSLGPNTFGAAYAAYVDAHGFSPDGRSEVLFVRDVELAYVMTRYREVHDFLHALTGLQPTVLDEVTLKWFEMAQTELPQCALSAFVGPARLPPHQLAWLATQGVPWACKAAVASPFFLNIPFEQCFSTDLEEMRRGLGLDLPPARPT